MDDLEKALNCYQCVLDDVCFGLTCTDCHLYQRSYLNAQDAMEAAIQRIHELENQIATGGVKFRGCGKN